MSDFDDLEAAVAEETTIDEAAVALLEGLAERIEALVEDPDPDALSTLAQQVRANSAKLSAAITANTSAATPPAPAPTGLAPAPADGTSAS